MPLNDLPLERVALHCERLGDHMIVTLSGDLDMASAPSLRERLNEALRDTTPRVVIDLSAVTFCDASGLAVLVGAARRTRGIGVTLVLAAPRPQVAQLLRLTGLDRALAVHGSVADARLGRAAA